MSDDQDDLWYGGSRNRKAPTKSQFPARKESKPATRHLSAVPDPKPEEISDRMWALAQYWMKVGTDTLGRRPPVNLPAFAVRLDQAINGHAWTLKNLGTFKPKDRDRGQHTTMQLQAAVDIFWREVKKDPEVPRGSKIQFYFVGDEYWPEWAYRGITAIEIADVKALQKVVQPMEMVPRSEQDEFKQRQAHDRYIQHVKAMREVDGVPRATPEERAERARIRQDFLKRAGKVRNQEGDTDDES